MEYCLDYEGSNEPFTDSIKAIISKGETFAGTNIYNSLFVAIRAKKPIISGRKYKGCEMMKYSDFKRLYT